MQDYQERRQKLLADIADCELIGSLAADETKRQTFRHLAMQMRRMVADLDAAMGPEREDHGSSAVRSQEDVAALQTSGQPRTADRTKPA